ncbi:MAG TPA: hypothetical protein VHI13_19725 [Candidatus Kapabacteria bacterium]|nr:hypothetical protein [Candidatus Kapabacteria bacterium]
MDHLPLRIAGPLVRDNAWIFTCMEEAVRSFSKERTGAIPAARASTNSSLFRDHVVYHVKNTQPDHPDTRIFEEGSNFFSLIVTSEHGPLALIFKKLRGSKPSYISTRRTQRIARQECQLSLDGANFTPTWAFAGWNWDAAGETLQAKHVVCWDNGLLAWKITQTDTLISEEALSIEFPEPQTTELLDKPTFGEILSLKETEIRRIQQSNG